MCLLHTKARALLLSAGDMFSHTVVCQQDILHLKKKKSQNSELHTHLYSPINYIRKKNMTFFVSLIIKLLMNNCVACKVGKPNVIYYILSERIYSGK